MIGWSEKEQKDDDVVCLKFSNFIVCFTYITTLYLILRS